MVRIGFGKVEARQALERVFGPEKLVEAEPPSRLQQAVSKILPFRQQGPIRVKGHGDLLAFLAKCCNPLPGDEIVGYITRGKGVSVHSVTCPNVVNLLYDAERRIEVEWEPPAGGVGAASYPVKLTMAVEDRKGVLAAVSAKIAGINTNITNLEARGGDQDHHARIEMTVEISDLKHLEKVMKSLRSVSGVLEGHAASCVVDSGEAGIVALDEIDIAARSHHVTRLDIASRQPGADPRRRPRSKLQRSLHTGGVERREHAS